MEMKNGVKGLYEECQVRIDAVYADFQARLAELIYNFAFHWLQVT